MDAALCALQQGNVDVRVLQETKLTREVYIYYRAGYAVWMKQAESIYCRGVKVTWREKVG